MAEGRAVLQETRLQSALTETLQLNKDKFYKSVFMRLYLVLI